MAKCGYAGTILEVDLSSGNINHIPTSDYADKFLGGRGIGTRLYWDEVPPDVQALDPENRLIFITGPTTGVPPAGPRCQVFSKSPVSDKFCYGSFAGKGWGAQLKFAGFDGLVVGGKAEKPVYLSIEDGRAEVKDATALRGKGSIDTSTALKNELGNNVRVLSVGPAGENKVIFATMLADGDASVSSGFGAVMGAKNLKAIAVRGNEKTAVADRQELKQITDEYRRVRKARARLVRLQGQLLAIVDQMQELRVAQGERDLDKIRSTASHSRR